MESLRSRDMRSRDKSDGQMKKNNFSPIKNPRHFNNLDGPCPSGLVHWSLDVFGRCPVGQQNILDGFGHVHISPY